MTIIGALVGLLFVVCYLGMTISTGIEGPKGKAVLWGCWFTAVATMLVCYSVSPIS